MGEGSVRSSFFSKIVIHAVKACFILNEVLVGTSCQKGRGWLRLVVRKPLFGVSVPHKLGSTTTQYG